MSSNSLLSYVGWAFLPNLVTGWVQSLYYGMTIRVGEPRPQPGSPRFMKHRRRIHILVICTYLLYTIYEADYDIRRAGSFYHDLGVDLVADEKKIRSKFRRLAAQFHPDKVASHSHTAEAYFVHLKLAQDTLVNSSKRFAYDHFGPDSVQWQHCSSIRDYLLVGIQTTVPYYIGSGFGIVLLSALGYLSWGRYWRYVLFGALIVLELHTLTRPDSSLPLLKFLNIVLTTVSTHPPLLPFQFLVLVRKVVITMFIFMSQLAGHFQDTTASTGSKHNYHQLNRLNTLVRAIEGEADRLLQLNFSPFQGDEESIKEVRGKVREWLVQNTVRSDPEVRNAVGRVLEKRKRPNGVAPVPGSQR